MANIFIFGEDISEKNDFGYHYAFFHRRRFFNFQKLNDYQIDDALQSIGLFQHNCVVVFPLRSSLQEDLVLDMKKCGITVWMNETQPTSVAIALNSHISSLENMCFQVRKFEYHYDKRRLSSSGNHFVAHSRL